MQSILNNEKAINTLKNDTTDINIIKPKIKIFDHTEIFNDTNIIYYKIMILTDSMFVWISSELLNEKNNITHFNNLAMSMKTKFSPVPIVTTLLGNTLEETSEHMSRRLSTKFFKQVFVSYNITSNNPDISVFSERSLMVSKEREVAIEAVLKACNVCQKVFNTLVKGETVIKADESPVTIGDFAAQAIVSITLQKYFPDFKLVGEENSNALKESENLRKRVTELVNGTLENEYTEEEIMKAIDKGTFEGGSSDNFWVIDPIDGTKGFLRGGQYAVCLGYAVNGEITLGVLGCPNLPCNDMDDNGPK
eukprot:jgi/Orpsp1_1/1175970/evm.model.c7180000055910.1